MPEEEQSPGAVDLVGATVGQDFLRSRRSGRMGTELGCWGIFLVSPWECSKGKRNESEKECVCYLFLNPPPFKPFRDLDLSKSRLSRL